MGSDGTGQSTVYQRGMMEYQNQGTVQRGVTLNTENRYTLYSHRGRRRIARIPRMRYD
jgi:hypothetical protein